MKNKDVSEVLMTLVICLFISVACAVLTTKGYQQVIEFFTDKNMSLWKIYWLSFGINVLKHNPLIVTKTLEDEGPAKFIGYMISALILDLLAVYLIIPYALS